MIASLDLQIDSLSNVSGENPSSLNFLLFQIQVESHPSVKKPKPMLSLCSCCSASGCLAMACERFFEEAHESMFRLLESSLERLEDTISDVFEVESP